MYELRSFIVFLLILEACSYPLHCPDISQRQLRETGYCTNSLKSEYSCLYDTYWLWFSEQCNKNPDYVTPGEKYVISGSLRNVECSSIRYQPFPLWSNVSGECLFQKSQCTEEGQILYNNGSHISDGTCRCDNTKGYKFIRQPKQNYFCTPSEEDCSCYFIKCPNCSVLSSDYECEEKLQANSTCAPIEIESSGIWKKQNIKSYTDRQEQPRTHLIVVGTMFVLLLAYIVIVSVLWEKIPQIDYKQGNTLKRKELKYKEIVKLQDDTIAKLGQLLEERINEIDRDKEIQTNEIKKTQNYIRTLETEKRNLYNQIQESKGNIIVLCRVRPLLDHEKQGHNCKIDHITFPGSNKIAVVKTSNGVLKENKRPITFSFDKVFQHEATQDQVFGEVSNLIQSALDGYNVCIFAYGQTGSGKTYTMEGTSVYDDDTRGIIPRSVVQIFDSIQKLTIEGWKYSVDVSCLEIYGKEINDLLCKKKVGLTYEIQDVNNEVCVTNITTERVTTEKEVYQLLQKASEKRKVADTKSNLRSSRSHSVLTLKLTGENSISKKTTKSTLNLVDLAGSERPKTSGTEGQQLQEAIAINLSLSTLGKFIRAIRDKQKVIFYRESKLTQLLHRSIGGNSKTLMFVNVSPKIDCVEETINSLKFATDANQCRKGIAQQNK